MSSWFQDRFLSVDSETTGVDIEDDRILTAAVLTIDPANHAVATRDWIIDPGVPVPMEAAAIHGYDSARIQAEGRKDVAIAISEIADAVMDAVHARLPIVIYNAPFDLSLLDRETRRYGLKPLQQRFHDAVEAPVVIDPLVLDKHLDRYRKGSRRLTDVSAHYGVPVGDDAHGCVADALASARVAYRLCQQYPQIAKMPLQKLHAMQVTAKAEQSASFRAYLKRQGKPFDDVRDEWPLIPFEPVHQGVLT